MKFNFDLIVEQILWETHASGEFDRLLDRFEKEGLARVKEGKRSGVFLILPNDGSEMRTVHRAPHAMSDLLRFFRKLKDKKEESEKKDEMDDARKKELEALYAEKPWLRFQKEKRR